uniref:Uncharacterized protein n=1 Tax=Mycena chlorophos TaxID=658473 RepID=A0ABQ0LL91_MYCCL|nr:predicted protein [Mycena chlorophos]
MGPLGNENLDAVDALDNKQPGHEQATHRCLELTRTRWYWMKMESDNDDALCMSSSRVFSSLASWADTSRAGAHPRRRLADPPAQFLPATRPSIDIALHRIASLRLSTTTTRQERAEQDGAATTKRVPHTRFAARPEPPGSSTTNYKESLRSRLLKSQSSGSSSECRARWSIAVLSPESAGRCESRRTHSRMVMV